MNTAEKTLISSFGDSPSYPEMVLPIKADPFNYTKPADLVGFSTLPKHVHRKIAKKGSDFTLMVVGETGLGKSTLINNLFLRDFYPDRVRPNLSCPTMRLQTSTAEIEERGVRLKLNIVDSPGFGDAVRNNDCSKPILQYIDEQFERYLRDESSLNRWNIIDSRVHCCLYFISPFGHGLKPLDTEIMRQLYNKVNIIPVIAKSDALTRKELVQMKRRVMQELEESDIRIYTLPACDSEEDDDYVGLVKRLKASMPFAVSSSFATADVEGRQVRGRVYPWGVVETENPDHCDFLNLKAMLITHMEDLKEATHELYENYRSFRLSGSSLIYCLLKGFCPKACVVE